MRLTCFLYSLLVPPPMRTIGRWPDRCKCRRIILCSREPTWSKLAVDPPTIPYGQQVDGVLWHGRLLVEWQVRGVSPVGLLQVSDLTFFVVPNYSCFCSLNFLLMILKIRLLIYRRTHLLFLCNSAPNSAPNSGPNSACVNRLKPTVQPSLNPGPCIN